MSRFGDDIRRIARTKELKDLIDQLVIEKGAIDAARGIAYRDVAGVTTGIPLGPKDSVLEQLANIGLAGITKGVTDALEEAAAEEAKKAAGGRPAIQNETDLEDIIDGAEGVPGAIEAITGAIDIVTGADLVLKHNGLFDAAAASAGGTLGQPNPTSEWENGTTPPAALDYVPGCFFTGAAGSGYTLQYSLGVQGQIDNNSSADQFKNWEPDTPEEVAATLTPGSNAQLSIPFKVTRVGGGSDFLLAINVGRCDRAAGLNPGMAAACGSSVPTDTAYPSSHTSRIALGLDGIWTSSEYDASDVGHAFRDGVGCVTVKFAGGTRYAALFAGKNNTTIIVEIDATTKEPIGQARIYDRGDFKKDIELTPYGQATVTSGSRGKYIESISASDLAKHLPNNSASLTYVSLTGVRRK